MRGSVCTAAMAALLCVGMVAVGTPAAFADDDEDSSPGIETNSDNDSGTGTDATDYGYPPILEPNRDAVAPQPSNGEPVDPDQTVAERDEGDTAVENFDFDA